MPTITFDSVLHSDRKGRDAEVRRFLEQDKKSHGKATASWALECRKSASTHMNGLKGGM